MKDLTFNFTCMLQFCYISGRKITISKRCSGFVGLWENSILQSNYFEMPVSGLQSNIKDIIGFKMSSGATAVEFCGVVKQDNQDTYCGYPLYPTVGIHSGYRKITRIPTARALPCV